MSVRLRLGRRRPRHEQEGTNELVTTGRRLITEMERIVTTEVPLIPNYFDVYTTPHVASLQGPVARLVPVDWDNPFLYIHKWEWRS